MRKFAIALCAAVLTSVSGLASAATIPATASTVIIGDDTNKGGQQRFTNWIASLDIYEAGFSIYKVARVYRPDVNNGGLTVQHDDKRGRTGSWTWTGSEAASFVLFKGRSTFAANYYSSPLFANDWDTGSLGLVNQNGGSVRLNHVSIFGVTGTLKAVSASPSPVPLPAAGSLLLAGLVGMFAARRRRA